MLRTQVSNWPLRYRSFSDHSASLTQIQLLRTAFGAQAIISIIYL